MDLLELRIVPAFPDFNFPASSARFGSIIAFGADTGGGPRVQVFNNHTKVFDDFVFEPTFLGGVDVSFDQNGNLHTGAGVGGATRHQIYNNNLIKTDDFFEPYPHNQGITITFGITRNYYYLSHEVYQEYFAQPWPESPGDVTFANQDLALLPITLQRALNSYPVYTFQGNTLSELPTFSWLPNTQTSEKYDGNRTYSQLDGGAFHNLAIMSDKRQDMVLHEVAHHLEPDNWITFFNPIFAQTEYELNPSESWAESLRRFVKGYYVAPEIKEYINVFIRSQKY